MKRNYSANDAAKCLRALQDTNPNLEIDTHILIGFPGESRQDFLQTLQLLDIVRFRHPMPFIYTDRPGTESSKMKGKVPLYVQALRLYQFRKKIAAVSRKQITEIFTKSVDSTLETG
jgi:tRNA-2-methylthio-N6-dimethylallyladenosine synthase